MDNAIQYKTYKYFIQSLLFTDLNDASTEVYLLQTVKRFVSLVRLPDLPENKIIY